MALGAVFTVVMLAVGANYLFDGIVGGVARSGVATVWEATRATEEAIAGLHLFSTRTSLARQLEEAQARADKAGAYYADYKQLRAEFDALMHTRTQEIRGTTMSTTTEVVHQATRPHVTAARVLSSYGASPYGTIVIGAGENDGVIQGDVALVSDQTAVGVVSQVDDDTSLVTLFSAPGAVHTVLIGQGASTTPAQLKGRGNGNFEAEVLRDASVAVGDVAALRSGYVIALVGRVDRAPEDPSQHVLLRVPINLETVRFVDIVRVPFIEDDSSKAESEAE